MSAPGRCLLPGEVSASREGVSAPRGLSAPRGGGLSAPREVSVRGCLLWGVSALGGCLLRGVSVPGGCLLPGVCVYQHALRQTPPSEQNS